MTRRKMNGNSCKDCKHYSKPHINEHAKSVFVCGRYVTRSIQFKMVERDLSVDVEWIEV